MGWKQYQQLYHDIECTQQLDHKQESSRLFPNSCSYCNCKIKVDAHNNCIHCGAPV